MYIIIIIITVIKNPFVHYRLILERMYIYIRLKGRWNDLLEYFSFSFRVNKNLLLQNHSEPTRCKKSFQKNDALLGTLRYGTARLCTVAIPVTSCRVYHYGFPAVALLSTTGKCLGTYSSLREYKPAVYFSF